MCILTSFWVLRALESWLKYFFEPFSTFFLNFKHFQWFFAWNEEKCWKLLKKLCFKLLFKAGCHANAGRLPEGVQTIDGCKWCIFHLKYYKVLTELCLFIPSFNLANTFVSCSDQHMSRIPIWNYVCSFCSFWRFWFDERTKTLDLPLLYFPGLSIVIIEVVISFYWNLISLWILLRTLFCLLCVHVVSARLKIKTQ